MTIPDMHPDRMGSHHCTRENVSHIIGLMKKVESGEVEMESLDWRTTCGTVALIMSWMLEHVDQ